jgi:uncharacterized spore protein YtfJ
MSYRDGIGLAASREPSGCSAGSDDKAQDADIATERKDEVVSKLDDILEGARDAITVRRVYGDPYEKDGVTFVPAAAVRGGGGGGEGEDANSSTGSGGGFGVLARPVGAYQIKDGEVTWVPAADTTKVILFAQVVAIVALLVLRSILRSHRE